MGGRGTNSKDVWPVLGVVLMAVYPFVTVTANNLGHLVNLRVIVLWIAAVAGIGLVIVGLSSWIGSATRTARFLIPWVWLIFNFYTFERVHPSNPHLLWIGAMATVGSVMVFASRSRWVGLFLTLWAGLLVAVPVIELVAYSPSASASSLDGPTDESIARMPNVWLFIPDGYTSPSEAERQAGVDMSSFLADLHRRGFETPDGLASYPLTYLSLSSMLDQRLLVGEGDNAQERKPFYERIQGANRTVDQFKAWGYEFVFATTGMWEGSECPKSQDTCVTGDLMSRTSRIILSMTPFESLVDFTDDVEEVARYSDPGFIVDRVSEVDPAEPYLVVAHLIEPHPPSFRTAGCGIRADVSLEFQRAVWDPDGFRDSVECLNSRFVEAIDRIVADAPDAVIVIQADHGTHAGYELPVPPDHRYEVLAAVRGPCDIPDPLAMVNTMRVVTACLAGEEPELLDYQSFWLEGFTVRHR